MTNPPLRFNPATGNLQSDLAEAKSLVGYFGAPTAVVVGAAGATRQTFTCDGPSATWF